MKVRSPFRYLFSRQSWGFGRFGQKTLLDLVQVLVALSIPVVVLFMGSSFTRSQSESQLQAEEQRAKAQLNVEEQRAQDAAMQAYLEEMGRLLLEGKLLESNEGDVVRTIAQARTLTALSQLDATRDGSVVQFLHNSTLIAPKDQESEPVISLSNADLGGVRLPNADLRRAKLSGAVLYNADLSNADLREADLRDTPLHCADLSNSDLRGAQIDHTTMLIAADLSRANLSELELRDTSLDSAVLAFAILRNTTLAGIVNLNNANLSGANLSGANLSELREGGRGPLTQGQIEQAQGVSQEQYPDPERHTKLPSYLQTPTVWTNSDLVALQEKQLAGREMAALPPEARREKMEARREEIEAWREEMEALPPETRREEMEARREEMEAQYEARPELEALQEAHQETEQQAQRERAQTCREKYSLDPSLRVSANPLLP